MFSCTHNALFSILPGKRKREKINLFENAIPQQIVDYEVQYTEAPDHSKAIHYSHNGVPKAIVVNLVSIFVGYSVNQIVTAATMALGNTTLIFFTACAGTVALPTSAITAHNLRSVSRWEFILSFDGS